MCMALGIHVIWMHLNGHLIKLFCNARLFIIYHQSSFAGSLIPYYSYFPFANIVIFYAMKCVRSRTAFFGHVHILRCVYMCACVFYFHLIQGCVKDSKNQIHPNSFQPSLLSSLFFPFFLPIFLKDITYVLRFIFTPNNVCTKLKVENIALHSIFFYCSCWPSTRKKNYIIRFLFFFFLHRLTWEEHLTSDTEAIEKAFFFKLILCSNDMDVVIVSKRRNRIP